MTPGCTLPLQDASDDDQSRQRSFRSIPNKNSKDWIIKSGTGIWLEESGSYALWFFHQKVLES